VGNPLGELLSKIKKKGFTDSFHHLAGAEAGGLTSNIILNSAEKRGRKSPSLKMDKLSFQ
jgi:hypothetical protein